MGARACATVEKDICLVSVVLPGFLPAEILRKNGGQMQTPPGFGTPLLPTTQGSGLGPACPTEGTWDPSPSHHVLRLGNSALGTVC